MWDSNSDSNNFCPQLMLFQLEKKITFFFWVQWNNKYKCETLSFHLSSISHPLHNLNSKCGKTFWNESYKRMRRKKNQQNKMKARQFVPAPRVIARRRWYKAPQKIPVSALAVASLPDIVHHSVAVFGSRSPQPFNLYPWMEQVRLTLVKPEWENPLMIPP